MSLKATRQAIDAARQAIQQGHYPIACELLRPLLGAGEAGVEGRYLAALAHAKIGALSQARRLVAGLADDPQAKALRCDILSLSGRIAKDQWSRLPEGPDKHAAAASAITCYLQAWNESRDPFPGVNAATLLALDGEADRARDLARLVLQRAQDPDTAQSPWWRAATLGELNLLLGNIDTAAQHYAAAAQAAGDRRGDIASMRRQLRLLTTCSAAASRLLEQLPIPAVVVFSGHMIDAADRQQARFPSALAPQVATAIADALDELGAGIGFSSAACGADLLFIEAMQARGGESHIVLPFQRDDFRETSVDFANADWAPRFDRALQRASSVSYAVEERFLGDQSLFEHAGLLMMGAAWLKAEHLQTECRMLAVIDEQAKSLPGGTRSLVEQWVSLHRPLHSIDLQRLRRDAGLINTTQTPACRIERAAETRASPHRREVVSMLFADMVGYSRLEEEDTPAYLRHFLGTIAELLQSAPTTPLFANTWGDGLFLVFEHAVDAAQCALRLRDAVQTMDWTARGLPAGTSIRVGMHSGPVFRARDPLLGRDNYFGSHVTRAARIEPITPPGDVFISAETAYVLAAECDAGLVADYVGDTPLAKNYANAVLYRLRHAAEIN